MTDSAPSENPFDQIADAPGGAGDGGPSSSSNMFDAIPDEPEQQQPQSSAVGAFARSAERSALPAAGGLAAAGAGAEAGAAIGAFGGPVGAAVGGIVGGIGGMFAGGWAAEKAQSYALSKMPDSWVDTLGQSEQQQQEDATQYPKSSFLGGLVPYAVTMNPMGAAKAALPGTATAFQRIAANPTTARLFGGAAMGGMELGQEALDGQRPDWTRVAIATGFGTVFNRPNRIGEKLTEIGAGPVRAAFGREGPAVQVADVTAPTVAQAGDLKVMGPGVTEEVFQGSHQQDPTAEMTAQDAARTEQSILSPQEPAGPDVHAVARRMEPDLFQEYDALASRREQFRSWIEEHNNPSDESLQTFDTQRAELEAKLAEVPTSGAGQNKKEARRLRAQIRDVQSQRDALQARRDAFAAGNGEETPEAAIARQHLLDTDYKMRDLAPQVAAANRRAADAIGAGTHPPEEAAAAPAASGPAPFGSLAEMIAARGEAPAESSGSVAPKAEQPEVVEKSAENPVNPTNTPESVEPPHTASEPLDSWRYQQFIASDVQQRLIAAGRPADEAEASGRLIAARYATRAARFRGALGTAEDLYRREGAEIQGPAGSPRVAALRPAAAPAPARPAKRATLPNVVPRPTGPRAPNLAEFIRSRGRMKDERGDFKSAGLHSLDILDNENGMPADMMREAAAEAGYLGGDKDRLMQETTVDDLLQTLMRHPTYSVHDIEEVLAREEQTQAREDSQRYRQTAKDVRASAEAAGGKVEDKALLHEAAKLVADKGLAWDDALERAAIEGENGGEAYGEGAQGEGEGDSQAGGGGAAPDDQGLPYETGEPEGFAGEDREPAYAQDVTDPFDFFQDARGKVRITPGRRPVISLMKDANASTFIHESGHVFLEELMRDANHEAAPDVLRDDAQTARDWLGVDAGEDLKTRHHEKFARGFEQYMREGVAPSPGLSSVFGQFRKWLVSLYETVKGLGKPIDDDIKSVFDRLIAEEPQRTVIAPERTGGPSLADIHETDAALTEPHEADAAHDRVIAERDQYIMDQPEEIRRELEKAHAKIEAGSGEQQGGGEQPGEQQRGGGAGSTDAGTESGSGLIRQPEMGGSSSGPGSEPAGGGRGAERGAVEPGGDAAGGEGASVRGGAAGARGPVDRAGNGLAPSPSDLFGPTESPFVDRAGNIRLENLTNREDVARAIREAAEANDDFIGDRRGVVSDGQVMELADAIGMDYDMLMRRKVGQAFNAEQIMSARKLLIQSATNVSETMKRAAVGSDEDVMAYAEAKDRHQLIQAHVAGITAEAGRALRAFRNIAGQGAAEGVDQFLRTATGKTLFQLKEEAKLGSSLETPQQVSKFMADAQKRTFGKMILEYWMNGLISGPATHTTYAVGNEILSLHKAGPETAAAAAIGAIRAQFGREGTRVRLGEVAAQLRGMGQGVAPGLQSALDALRTGVTTQLPGEADMMQSTLPFQPGTEHAQAALLNEAATIHDAMGSAFGLFRGAKDAIIGAGALLKAGGIEGAPLIGAQYSHLGAIPDIAIRGVNVLPVGSAIRLPGRGVAAIHSFFRAMNYSMEKNAIAYRMASDEGRTGQDFDARVADIRQNPSPEVMTQSTNEATNLTLMGAGGDFTRQLAKLTNTNILGFPVFKFIDPFVKISSAIIEQSLLQRSPLGWLAPEIRADLLGKNGNIAQDRAQARMLVGSALSIGFGSLAAKGLISGSGPSDPRESSIWRMAGNQAHSFRIGEIWYDMHRLGPLGMLLGSSADLYDVAHKASKGDMLTAAAALQHAFTQNVLDESFMKGPADLIKAVEDPGRYGEAYLRNFVSSFVPYSVGMAQMARAADPYSRQARTILDAIKAKIPGQSESLYPRIDIWGNPMQNKDALGMAGLTAIYEQQVSHDPVNLAMLQLGVHPATVERKIRNVELSDEQYDFYARTAGHTAKQRLDMIVRAPQFQTWPASSRHDVISEVIRQSREAARGLTMHTWPQIPNEAALAKKTRRNWEPDEE